MWAVIVDGIIICWCASESDAIRIKLNQPYGADVKIEYDSD